MLGLTGAVLKVLELFLLDSGLAVYGFGGERPQSGIGASSGFSALTGQ